MCAKSEPMRKPESKFQDKVQSRFRELQKLGASLWWVKAQMVAIRGIPDLLICANGVFVAWELKVGNNKASDLQGWTLDNISKAGGTARVVTPENFDEQLKELACLCGIELSPSSRRNQKSFTYRPPRSK